MRNGRKTCREMEEKTFFFRKKKNRKWPKRLFKTESNIFFPKNFFLTFKFLLMTLQRLKPSDFISYCLIDFYFKGNYHQRTILSPTCLCKTFQNHFCIFKLLAKKSEMSDISWHVKLTTWNPNVSIYKSSFIGMKPSSFIYMLSQTAFMMAELSSYRGQVAHKPGTLTFLAFIGKACLMGVSSLNPGTMFQILRSF